MRILASTCSYITCICIILSCSSIPYNNSIETHRAAYQADFQTSDYAPLKGEQLDDMDFFPPNSKYLVNAHIILNEDRESYDVETSSGMKKEFYTYGYATFELKGKEIRLELIRNLKLIRMPQYKDYLFLAFTDLTSGDQTYGGGRYIDLSIADIKDGMLEIDFNKAYNPYCAYSDGYNCPIPPAQNFIDLKIKAGEKLYKGEYLGAH